MTAGFDDDAAVFEHWQHVPAGLWRWRFFTPAEIACRGTGEIRIVPHALDRLERLRELWGKPLMLSSAYRSAAHNAAIGGGPAHRTGEAFDIRIAGVAAWDLLRLVSAEGWTGIGVSQAGVPAQRFLHIDLCDPGPGLPRPALWSYGTRGE